MRRYERVSSSRCSGRAVAARPPCFGSPPGSSRSDEGRITIAGVPVTGARKDACMVFQNFGLLPWRTVLGNVEFRLEIDGMGAAERRDMAGHFIECMISSRNMPPRRTVPAPQPALAQRLRDLLLSPNAIRTASLAVFFVIWEYYGRRM